MLKSSSGAGRDSSTSPPAFPKGPSFHNLPSEKRAGTSAQPHRAKSLFQTPQAMHRVLLLSQPLCVPAELGSTHTALFIPKVLVISANYTQGTAVPG